MHFILFGQPQKFLKAWCLAFMWTNSVVIKQDTQVKYCQIHKIQLTGKRIRGKITLQLACRITHRLNYECDASYSHQYASSSEYWRNGSSLSIDITYRPTIGLPLLVDISTDISVDMSTDTSQSTYQPTLHQYVGRHIGRHLAGMSADTSVECRLICRPIYRSRGAQNTHDPNCFSKYHTSWITSGQKSNLE